MFRSRHALLFGGSVITLAQSYNLFSIARRLRNSQKQEILRFYHARIEPRMLADKREVENVQSNEPEWFLRYEAEENKRKTKKKEDTKIDRRHKELPEPESVLESAKFIPRPASLTKPGLASAVRWNVDLFHFYHITKLERSRKFSQNYFTKACTDAIQWFLDESCQSSTLTTLYHSIHREVISRYLLHGRKSQADLQWFFDFLVSHPCGDVALMMDLEEVASSKGFSLASDSTWHEVLAKACRHNYPDSQTLLRGLHFVKNVPDWLFDCFCRYFAKNQPDSVRELLSWKRDHSRLLVKDLLHFGGPHMAQSCRRFYPHCTDRGDAVSMQKIRWKLVSEAISNPKLSLDDLILLMQPDIFERHSSTWKMESSLAPYLNHALTKLCDSKANPNLTKELMDLMLSYEIPFTETSVKRAVPFTLQSVSKPVNMWADIAQSGPIDKRHENFYQLHKAVLPKQQEQLPETFFIPCAFAGKVLGEKGQIMQSIREESGARISIMPEEEGESHRMIRISGPKDKREQAIALLRSCTLLKSKQRKDAQRAGLSQRIECITEGFMASQKPAQTFEWLEFVHKSFKIDRKKLCQGVLRAKVDRSAKFGLLQSFYTYETIFGPIPNAIVDKSMRMCALKGHVSLALDLFETLQRPGRTFTKEFYADLILTLLRDGKQEEASHVLKRAGDTALDSLHSLQAKLPSAGKLTFSDRQLLSNFDQLRETHLQSNSHQWQQFAERNLIRFQDRLKLDLDFDILSDRNVNIRTRLSRLCESLDISFQPTISGRCIRIYVKTGKHLEHLDSFLQNLGIRAMSYPRMKQKGFILFLKPSHEIELVPNGINFQMKYVEMTDLEKSETLPEIHVDVSNDWLPKRVQVERVFVEWMAANEIGAILNALNDGPRWVNFLHAKTIGLPLARFLANHGQIQKAIELLTMITPQLQISPLTFITLTKHISSLDFACLTESENTRRRSPPKLEDILCGYISFMDHFRLKPNAKVKRHLETICVENYHFPSLEDALKKHGFSLTKNFQIVKDTARRNAADSSTSPRFLEAA